MVKAIIFSAIIFKNKVGNVQALTRELKKDGILIDFEPDFIRASLSKTFIGIDKTDIMNQVKYYEISAKENAIKFGNDLIILESEIDSLGHDNIQADYFEIIETNYLINHTSIEQYNNISELVKALYSVHGGIHNDISIHGIDKNGKIFFIDLPEISRIRKESNNSRETASNS